MSQVKTKKRNKSTTGIKVLIASASVAATLAGWALLPANDPAAAATQQPSNSQAPAITAPGTTDPSTSGGSQGQTLPGFTSPFQQTTPNQGTGGFTAPSGTSGFTLPFSSTRSSR